MRPAYWAYAPAMGLVLSMFPSGLCPDPFLAGKAGKEASFLSTGQGCSVRFVKGFRGINPRAAEAALRFIPRFPDYVPAPGSETAFSVFGMSGLLGISNGYAPVV